MTLPYQPIHWDFRYFFFFVLVVVAHVQMATVRDHRMQSNQFTAYARQVPLFDCQKACMLAQHFAKRKTDLVR